MSSDDLKNDSSRNTCAFNAHIFLLLSGERGVDFKTGEGKKSLFMVPLIPLLHGKAAVKKNGWNCYSA